MITLPATVNLSVYRGDTWQQEFRLLRGAVPVDLSSSTIECWARAGTSPVQMLTATILAPPTDGRFTLSAPSAGPLPAGSYTYDVEVTSEPGTIVTTWIRGELVVAADITNAPATLRKVASHG